MNETYIARARCGCIRGAAVNDPERLGDVAEWVAGWIRGGLDVRLYPTARVREMDWKCGADDCPFLPRIRQLTMTIP